MTDLAERALLPAGLRDILPPFAAREAEVVTRLMAVFASHGYERVKPPLIEFEASAFGDGGAQSGMSAAQTFRVMDPLTQSMMAVRSDMTPQVARIAATRLGRQQRPLRLAYAGQVLRTRGSQLRAERQFGQVGAELIGAADLTAEAEILALCTEALALVGLTRISVDLTLATLVPLILGANGGGEGAGGDGAGGEGSSHMLRDALDHKDVSAVLASGGKSAKLLTGLIEAVGPADRALARLMALDLPSVAARERNRLQQVVGLIRKTLPQLVLTIDPVENRGFEYHTGIGFTIFAADCAGEIGHGGRYSAHGEAAVGATLFMDTLLEILPGARPPRRVFLPLGSDAGLAARLRGDGWVTIAGLAPAADDLREATRLRCGHLLVDGRLQEIGQEIGQDQDQA